MELNYPPGRKIKLYFICMHGRRFYLFPEKIGQGCLLDRIEKLHFRDARQPFRLGYDWAQLSDPGKERADAQTRAHAGFLHDTEASENECRHQAADDHAGDMMIHRASFFTRFFHGLPLAGQATR